MNSASRSELGLFISVIFLTVIGLWMVLDTSYVQALYSPHLQEDPFFFVKRQALGAFLGLASLVLFLRLDYRILRTLAIPILLVGIALLMAVHIPHIGIIENGAARWIHLGPLRFQPSELAKLCLILYIAARLSNPREEEASHQKASYKLSRSGVPIEQLVPVLLVSLLYLMLIERQPDLGTAFVLFLAVCTQLFLAGARLQHLLLFGGLLGVLVLSSCLVGKNSANRQGRILVFLHPHTDLQGIGYQIYHARLAVGSGEWTGLGLGRGREKYYLPQANSDFVFATYAEETGFVGACCLLLLFGIITWRGFVIAKRAPDRFGALLAAGLTALLSWQALLNIGVASDSLPPTGVPLPFISNGSSSLVLMLTSVGLLLSIARSSAVEQQPPPSLQIVGSPPKRSA